MRRVRGATIGFDLTGQMAQAIRVTLKWKTNFSTLNGNPLKLTNYLLISLARDRV